MGSPGMSADKFHERFDNLEEAKLDLCYVDDPS
jgi:hypothetical protein